MFDWVFEGRLMLTVTLAALAVIAAALWWQGRQRHWLVAAGVLLGLLGLYVLLDALVDTEREENRKQIQGRLEGMAAAVRAKDVTALFANVADDFHSPNGKPREQCVDFARGLLQQGQVTDVTMWDFEFEKEPSRAQRTANVWFFFKVRGPVVGGETIQFRCAATMTWTTRGWLLQAVKIFDPVRNEELKPF
jgi:hypothetical protein